MKISLLFFLILLPCYTEKLTGKVIGVMDGDTIEILYNQKPVRIRLNGIDCPEKNQDFGNKAKQFTSDLCFGKLVTVVDYGKDKYNRVLGNVILEDGRILNQELIKVGLSWHYKQYSQDPILADLETQARKEKIGLWSQSNPVAPWDFRHMKRY